MPPEALRLEGVEHRSDIYFFGVTMATFTNGGLCPVPHAGSEFEQINHTFNAEYEISRWGYYCNCFEDMSSSLALSFYDSRRMPNVSGETQATGRNSLKSCCLSLSHSSRDGLDNQMKSCCGMKSCYSASSTWLWDKVIPRPSIETRNFMSRCVKSDVALRPQANELLLHPFIQNAEMMHWTEVPKREPDPQVLQRVVDTIIEGQRNLEVGCCSPMNTLSRDWAQLPGFPELSRSLGVDECDLEASLIEASNNNQYSFKY